MTAIRYSNGNMVVVSEYKVGYTKISNIVFEIEKREYISHELSKRNGGEEKYPKCGSCCANATRTNC